MLGVVSTCIKEYDASFGVMRSWFKMLVRWNCRLKESGIEVVEIGIGVANLIEIVVLLSRAYWRKKNSCFQPRREKFLSLFFAMELGGLDYGPESWASDNWTSILHKIILRKTW